MLLDTFPVDCHVVMIVIIKVIKRNASQRVVCTILGTAILCVSDSTLNKWHYFADIWYLQRN